MGYPIKSYVPYPNNTEANTDAGGRIRVSMMTTLFDGKCLADDALIWENIGNGSEKWGSSSPPFK